MPNLAPQLSAEITAFVAAPDKREYLIARAEKLFDQLVEPLDLPGPDPLVDPLLRALIRPAVGRLFDEVVKELEGLADA